MKRLLGICVLTAVGLGGCWTLPFTQETKLPGPPPKVDVSQAKPHALVLPEQVDERNARQKAELLREELDLDERDAVPPKH
jgi:hypothetical protein